MIARRRRLTPDRVPDLPTALCGTGGALLASVAAEVFIRARSPMRPVELSADSPQKGPKDRYMTEVESWREIQSSNIEFTMKRLREPIERATEIAK
jgi:hypothetical protein